MTFTLSPPVPASHAEPRACCEACAKCACCRAVDGIEIGCLAEPSGHVRLYTQGLWQSGAPELHLAPPDPMPPGPPEGAGLVVFLTRGLLRVARGLLVGEASPAPSWPAWYRGRPVRFGLGPLEPPPPRLAEALPGEVDSVLRVTCSLF